MLQEDSKVLLSGDRQLFFEETESTVGPFEHKLRFTTSSRTFARQLQKSGDSTDYSFSLKQPIRTELLKKVDPQFVYKKAREVDCPFQVKHRPRCERFVLRVVVLEMECAESQQKSVDSQREHADSTFQVLQQAMLPAVLGHEVMQNQSFRSQYVGSKDFYSMQFKRIVSENKNNNPGMKVVASCISTPILVLARKKY